MDKKEFDNRISNINNSFKISKERIGAKDSTWELLPKKLLDIFRRFDKGEPISSVEIQEIKSKWSSEYPLIDENGKPFVLYIHDFSHSFFWKPNRVFHVAWCFTLKWMDKGGRKERYVKKTDLDNNNFLVDYGQNRVGKRTKQLPACYNCQNKMKTMIYPRELYYDRDNLDIVKFFQIYGKQDLVDMNNPIYSVDYPKDWPQIARRTKEERGNKCEECSRIDSL